ncbi:MAG: class II glutamine amidotransferase [Candidatus Nanopelagicaceae bacterium]|nr:class II glutamine amidotransferase [Candidatus Nanopelagicaceae bacterium]
MCRLLGYVANRPTSLADFAGPNFNEFVKLSEVHKDSWGLCLVDGATAKLQKQVEVAASSDSFAKVATDQSASGGLLHFRWASPGIEVNDLNAHPFSYQDIGFIHNGALSPYDALLPEISDEFLSLRKGNGDSELFFLFALTKIGQLGFVPGVLDAIRSIKKSYEYSSINSMFLNSDFLIVVSEHHPDNRPSWTEPNYYEVRYRLDSSGCLVASSGWSQEGWTLMPNHSALIVDRKSMNGELISL